MQYLLIIFLVSLIILIPQSARADAAPPDPPPGFNPETDGETTNVQMMYEEVVLEITGDTMLLESVDWDIENYEVKVIATFHMKNRGDEEERLSVRFPYVYRDRSWGDIRSLQNFKVYVGNQEIAWQEVETDRESGYWDYYSYISWAAFGVTFPPGKQVIIKVEYSTISTFDQDPITRINYVLETGAGWYGSILEGDIILRMPYKISEKNVFLSDKDSTNGGVYKGKKEVRWHFEDLEPTAEDNFSVVILDPGIWQTILDAQSALDKNPDDLQALVALAETAIQLPHTKANALSYNVFVEPFLLGQAAIERAIQINPDNPDYYPLYAEILIYRFMSERNQGWGEKINMPEPATTVEEIFEQLNKAELLEPGHEETQDIYQWLEYIAKWQDVWLPDLGPSPTVKPSATDKPISSDTVQPSETSVPSNTVTKTPIPPIPATDTPISPTDLPPINTPAPTENTGDALPCGSLPGLGVLFIVLMWQLWAFRQRGN